MPHNVSKVSLCSLGVRKKQPKIPSDSWLGSKISSMAVRLLSHIFPSESDLNFYRSSGSGVEVSFLRTLVTDPLLVSFRFLGNKSSLLPPIVDSVLDVASTGSHVVDPFCGTGSVSVALSEAGFHVTASDLLLSCVLHARAQLLPSSSPPFKGLADQVRKGDLPQTNLFARDVLYHRVLSLLNSLPGEEGFFYREYCRDGCPANGAEPRNYFSPENAKRIDTMRSRVKDWKKEDLITTVEHSVLLHDLMLATNAVANTTGTYGYFLSRLSESARRPIKLQPTQFSVENENNRICQGRAREVLSSVSPDVTYLDPPYNKRQYAAYYHILETIAHEDEPEVIGKSGLRPWQEKSSDFCYKTRAPDALRRVLKSTQANYAFVSYSEDGHIRHEQMKEILSEFGKAEHLELAHTRYSSHESTDSSSLTERLYRVELS